MKKRKTATETWLTNEMFKIFKTYHRLMKSAAIKKGIAAKKVTEKI